MNVHDLIAPVSKAVAVAVVLGGGTILLDTRLQNAVQDQRIQQLESTALKIDEIDRTIRRVDGKVDVLNQKLDDSLVRRR